MAFCLYGVGMDLNTIAHLYDKNKLSQKLADFVTIYATSVFNKQNWSQIMSRSTANVSFYCRESKKNKDGLAPIEQVIILNTRRCFIQLPRKDVSLGEMVE